MSTCVHLSILKKIVYVARPKIERLTMLPLSLGPDLDLQDADVTQSKYGVNAT